MSAFTGSRSRGSVDGVDLLAACLPALRAMTDSEREAFVDYYAVGDTDATIAGRIGYHRSRVEQLRKQARSRIRAMLEPLQVAA